MENPASFCSDCQMAMAAEQVEKPNLSRLIKLFWFGFHHLILFWGGTIVAL
jgi:hypothetical protein